ncbi:protease SohB [Psychrobacter sanguinis]|uniref:protease SohB n=1 Tax=Psychrobacter sanguinis TaxID=861445 RepID=UPI001918C714|nr:protease SohB [Psychrobacter sanguinis]MCC3307971.1 protease SohB [Psychrobacter sanguinis]MCC3344263.1 protease SohB [Psychrobacter sanguinis]MDY3307161.1 protease SohB [Psychrobacter sanguinis]UEC25263.1 protease SohB [Psychrobacter sanguinis]
MLFHPAKNLVELKVVHLNKSQDQRRKSLIEAMEDKNAVKQFQKALAKKAKQKLKEKGKSKQKEKRLFVLDFDGDIKASAVKHLREEISAIISTANKGDEVVLRLESGGGMVHGYGLAAAQLVRLKEAGLTLTVCVDKIAASGGYMMACVADKILAAPFAVVGSIGVVSQMPNFNKWLKKHDIDYEMFTAGEYKRTVTMFGENDDEDRAKYKEELEQTHELFKHFVTTYRPQLDLSKVANGDHWYGEDALKLNLVDELSTSDAYLLKQMEDYQAYALMSRQKPTFAEKLGLANAAHSAVSGMVNTATKSALTALGDKLPEVMSKIEQDKRLKF